MQSLRNVLLPRAFGSFLSPRSAMVARRVSRAFRSNDTGTARWITRLDFSDLCGASEQQVERLAADMRELKTFEVVGTLDRQGWSTREEAEQSARIVTAVLRQCTDTLTLISLVTSFPVGVEGLELLNFRRLKNLHVDIDNLAALIRGGATFPVAFGLIVQKSVGFEVFHSQEEIAGLEAVLLQHFPQLGAFCASDGLRLVPQGGPASTLRKVALDEQTWLEADVPRILESVPQSVTELFVWLDSPDTLDVAFVQDLLNRRPNLAILAVVQQAHASLEFANVLRDSNSRLQVVAKQVEMASPGEHASVTQQRNAWQHTAAVLAHMCRTSEGHRANIGQLPYMAERLRSLHTVLCVSGTGTAAMPLVESQDHQEGTSLCAPGVSGLVVNIIATDPERPAKHITLPCPLPPNLHLPDLQMTIASVTCSTTSLTVAMRLGDQMPRSGLGWGSLLDGLTQGKHIDSLELRRINVGGRSEGLRQLLACNADIAAAATCVRIELGQGQGRDEDKLLLQALSLAGGSLSGATRLAIEPSFILPKHIRPLLIRVLVALGGLEEVVVEDSDILDANDNAVIKEAVAELVRDAVAEAGLGDRVVVSMQESDESGSEADSDSA